MKRKSINHCEERSEMERWTGTPEGTCNVLRTFRETHAISAMASSTSRIREKAFRNESLDQNNARDCLQSCGFSGKWTSFLPFRFQLQDVSKSAQSRWRFELCRKRLVKSCGQSKKGLSLCFCELNYRIQGRKTEDKKELTVWALFASSSFARTVY